MRNRVLLLCLLLFGLGSHSYAQTSINPDISAVGDFRVYGHSDQSRADEVEKLNLADPEIEINIGGYLNPYARADIVIGWHGEHNAEIEEVHATILRGLPLNTNLRVGKYLLEYGRLNPVHPHAYSFIKRPLPHELFFGEEGLSDMAIRTSFALPIGSAFTELMGGVLKGDALANHEHEDAGHEGDEHEQESEAKRNVGLFTRLTTSMAVSESSELAIGGSALNAVHGFTEDTINTPKQLRSWLIGGDIKYKYKPSKFKSLQIEAEMIMRQSELGEDDEKLNSYGAYGYIDYRFNQIYNVGGIIEWARVEETHHHEGEDEHEIEEHGTKRYGLFVGFAPLEETSMVRLAGHWTDPEEGDGFWELSLQLVFGLGPHTPHNF
ncbi:MAG: hypothetical protein GY855_17470 [candidate division Zixibacteria bacterium]|nr:hypothetical protein [candidate division Zixibacteria bacterium]